MAQTSAAQAERMVVALDGWAAAWRAAHRETCETGIAQGDLPDADLDARMRCLQREQREVAATIALLAEADDALVRRTALLVDGLPRTGECLLATGEGADVRPAAAEQVAALEDRLAEARAQFDAGRYGDARDRLEPIVDEVRAVDHPPLLADVLALQGRVVQELGDLA